MCSHIFPFLDCDVGTFRCSQDDFCIPQSYVCDGIKDCLFSDDEANCITSKQKPPIKLYTHCIGT